MYFFDFSGYEYYGVIYAPNKEKAIEYYTSVIADIEDDDINKSPKKISKNEAKYIATKSKYKIMSNEHFNKIIKEKETCLIALDNHLL